MAARKITATRAKPKAAPVRKTTAPKVAPARKATALKAAMTKTQILTEISENTEEAWD